MCLSRKKYREDVEKIPKISLDTFLESEATEAHIEITEKSPQAGDPPYLHILDEGNSLQIYRTMFRLAGYEVIGSDFHDGADDPYGKTHHINRLYLHVRKTQPAQNSS